MIKLLGVSMFGKAVARGCLVHEERHCLSTLINREHSTDSQTHSSHMAIVYPGDYHDAKMEVIPPSKAISLVLFLYRRH